MRRRDRKYFGRRVLSLMLTIVMCVSLMNVTVFAEDEVVVGGNEISTAVGNEQTGIPQTVVTTPDGRELTLNFGNPPAVTPKENTDPTAPVAPPADNMAVGDDGQREAVPEDVTESPKIGELVVDEATGETEVVPHAPSTPSSSEIATIDTVDVGDAQDLATAIKNKEELSEGEYIVNDDIMISGAIAINGAVTIKGNAGTITRDGNDDSIFDVHPGSKLILENVTLSANENSVNPRKNTTSPINVMGELILNNCTIEGFASMHAGGLVILEGGIVTMNGGRIAGNKAVGGSSANGGGVFVQGGGTFIMNGGEINGNQAGMAVQHGYQMSSTVEGHGGGVNVSNGTFIMNSGSITDNKVIGESFAKGGGIFIEGDNAKVELVSGVISDNKAKVEDAYSPDKVYSDAIGGGIYVENYAFLHLNDAAIYNNSSVGQVVGGWSWFGPSEPVKSAGAGVWFCPNGEGQFYSTSGSYLSGNAADCDGDDFYSDGNNQKSIHLQTRLYDGTPVKWLYDNSAYVEEIGSEIPDINGWIGENVGCNIALKSETNKIAEGDSHYKLVIKNNSSFWGGGIACNGSLIMGENTDTELTVTKKWDNMDGTSTAPEGAAVTFDLVNKTLGKVVDSVVLNNEYGWTHTFTNLPSDQEFDVVEREVTGVDGYTASYDRSKTGKIIVTNSNAPKISLDVEKVWNNNDGTHIAPEGASVTVTLYRNNESTGQTVTLSSQNEWKGSFTNLAKIDENGKDYTYTVEETAYSGYTASYVTNEDGSITITNTQTPPPTPSETPTPSTPTTSVSVNKVWVGDEEANVRPASIQVQLYRNGTAYGSPVTLSAPGWNHTWRGLDVSGSYTVGEVNVPAGYDSLVQQNGNSFTVTNTWNPVPLSNNLTVEKKWVGDDENTRPASIQVQLYKDGAVDGEPVTLSAENDWTYTWTGLDPEANYTVSEVNVPENYTATTEQNGTVFTITNTYSEKEDIPDPDTPKSDKPDEPKKKDVTTITEPDTPRASAPAEELETIEDGAVPLSDAPDTGDGSPVAAWTIVMLASLLGIAALRIQLNAKRREQ